MSTYTERLKSALHNPSLMLDIVYNELDRQLNVEGQGGYDVPIAGAPFPWALENATLLTCIGMDENEALLRRQYPHLAQTPEDLYHHMSDRDFLNRFSNPSMTTFTFIADREEILGKVVDIPDSRTKRLTIPRLTRFDVGGYSFMMQYPVHIDLMTHGGLQLTYGADKPSPIQTLTSNMVKWSIVTVDGNDYLMLEVPVHQMALDTHKETINEAVGFRSSYQFENQFFTARVFVKNNTLWEEITTTHSDQVYDHRRVTAVLTVVGNSLTVEIPSVYFTQGMVRGEIRIDIYNTQGEIDVDLSTFDVDQFQTTYNSIDDDSRFTSPLKTFSNIQAFSRQRVTGGVDQLSFNLLRNQTIYNTVSEEEEAVTFNQLNAHLQRRGYRVVKSIDNVTDRQFVATRSLPSQSLPQHSGAIGSCMGVFQSKLEDLVDSSVVIDNNERITILPTSLYEYVNGKVVRVSDTTATNLNNLSVEARTNIINQRRFLFTPFHYVLDGTNGGFDVRPYLLTHPKVEEQQFIDVNPSAEMQIGITRYNVVSTEYGYRLTILAKSGERYKLIDPENLAFQLSYLPQRERTWASINGELLSVDDDEFTIGFDIETNFDVTDDDHLRTLNFSMFDDNQREFFTPLLGEFDITFIALNQDMRVYDPGPLDAMITRHLLPANTDRMVISRERLLIRLGQSLRGLWRRGRTILSPESYQRYTDNVQATYSETIYERDEDGQVILKVNDDGTVDYRTVLHEAGDPVFVNGEPRYLHLKGDLVLDDEGKKILIEPRKLMREYTLFLMDGLYYFSTDQRVVDYRDSVPTFIAGLLENDLQVFESNLRERTDLFLHPTTTFGDVTVEANQDERRTIPLGQSMSVEYYLQPSSYNNTPLRTSLTEMTHRVISELLDQETISISGITSRLRAEAGSDIVEVKVTGLGDGETPVVSIIDQSTRLALGKRAIVLPNMDISIQDDLDIIFLRHR